MTTVNLNQQILGRQGLNKFTGQFMLNPLTGRMVFQRHAQIGIKCPCVAPSRIIFQDDFSNRVLHTEFDGWYEANPGRNVVFAVGNGWIDYEYFWSGEVIAGATSKYGGLEMVELFNGVKRKVANRWPYDPAQPLIGYRPPVYYLTFAPRYTGWIVQSSVWGYYNELPDRADMLGNNINQILATWFSRNIYYEGVATGERSHTHHETELTIDGADQWFELTVMDNYNVLATTSHQKIVIEFKNGLATLIRRGVVGNAPDPTKPAIQSVPLGSSRVTIKWRTQIPDLYSMRNGKKFVGGGLAPTINSYTTRIRGDLARKSLIASLYVNGTEYARWAGAPYLAYTPIQPGGLSASLEYFRVVVPPLFSWVHSQYAANPTVYNDGKGDHLDFNYLNPVLTGTKACCTYHVPAYPLTVVPLDPNAPLLFPGATGNPILSGPIYNYGAKISKLGGLAGGLSTLPNDNDFWKNAIGRCRFVVSGSPSWGNCSFTFPDTNGNPDHSGNNAAIRVMNSLQPTIGQATATTRVFAGIGPTGQNIYLERCQISAANDGRIYLELIYREVFGTGSFYGWTGRYDIPLTGVPTFPLTIKFKDANPIGIFPSPFGPNDETQVTIYFTGAGGPQEPPPDPPPPGVLGCTDPTANNFNPLATVDDGSCTYDPPPPPPPPPPDPIYGCTNPNASNYNPNATVDDGSCVTCPPTTVWNPVTQRCECPPGEEWSEQYQECHVICPPRTYWNGISCVPISDPNA